MIELGDVIEVGDVIETADGHHARVLSMNSKTMRLRYDDGYVGTQEREEVPYLCKTCGATVQVGEDHRHGCPLEGDTCGSRRCNETGLCQA